MISIVYPLSINWFYERQAQLIKEELHRLGLEARLVASDQPDLLAEGPAEIALFVNLAETLVAARESRSIERLAQRIAPFKRKILLNHDSLFSPWFGKQIEVAEGFFTEIFDISMKRQTTRSEVFGMPYQWIPEALAQSQAENLLSWTPNRPIPWVMIGHATADRASLASALVQELSPSGFVFSPPLRPFRAGAGLCESDLSRVLSKSDLYVWGSHHRLPYHECLRALHAISYGAAPAKIDPLFSSNSHIPWTYSSVSALKERIEDAGCMYLYFEARSFIESQGRLGDNLATALGLKAAMEIDPLAKVAAQ